MSEVRGLHLGTQGFSYPSWVGPFYPPGTTSACFLEVYASHFRTVELDSTFYGAPRETTVDGWRKRTPPGFIFAAKFPQVITHEKLLLDCEAETLSFLHSMQRLGDKLGPLLLQMSPAFDVGMMGALQRYLDVLPSGPRYVLEVRHNSWQLRPNRQALLDLLRSRGVAICLVEHAWMPRMDDVTAPLAYVRWLGRREDVPGTDFSRVRIDRDAQLDSWSQQVGQYLARGVTVFGYFNNHYQGHSPASVRAFQARIESTRSKS